MDQDEPGRNSPHSGGQRPVSTVRSYSRLRSYTGHGNLTRKLCQYSGRKLPPPPLTETPTLYLVHSLVCLLVESWRRRRQCAMIKVADRMTKFMIFVGANVVAPRRPPRVRRDVARQAGLSPSRGNSSRLLSVFDHVTGRPSVTSARRSVISWR